MWLHYTILLLSIRFYYGSSNEENPRSHKISDEIKSFPAKSIISNKYNFDNFQNYETMVTYLKYLSTRFSNLTTLMIIGRTYENRDLFLVKITSPYNNTVSDKKPAIWIDAGIHAREWITGGVAMRLIYELVQNYKQNADIVQKYDWYIMPMANPDGYSYTWTNDRLWRKNRSPGRRCKGVDINRNFDMFWGEAASANECDETYRGSQIFSEKESIAIRDAIMQRKNQIKMYLSLHSYGQLLLFPWGVGTQKPRNYDKLFSVSSQAVGTIRKTTGRVYTNGQTTNIMYQAGGCSDDWSYGKANISLVYTFELRDQSTFLVGPEQIAPTFQELLAALKVMVTNIV